MILHVRSLPFFPVVLDVANNPLYGEIPADIGNMATLCKLECVSRCCYERVKNNALFFTLQLRCTRVAVFLEEPSPRVWAAFPNLVSRVDWNNAVSTLVNCLSHSLCLDSRFGRVQ
jgi:hypothetical protein